MKTLVCTILFCLVISINFSQTNDEIKEIKIDLASPERVVTKPIEPGTYNIFLVNVNPKATYNYSVELKNFNINKLVTPSDWSSEETLTTAELSLGKFEIKKGQRLVISITELLEVTDPNTKKTETKKKEFKYTYNTPQRGEWRTTFGFNFIYKIKQETYFSDNNDDNTFTIREARNRDKMDYHPTLMFTWLSSNYLDKKMNWQFGLSGGLGYDLDQSLSVFTGPSFIYNENITLTVGIAFHNQKRLLSQYNPGDEINDNLTFAQLHKDYLRVNPFISLSFRLDKNPFGG